MRKIICYFSYLMLFLLCSYVCAADSTNVSVTDSTKITLPQVNPIKPSGFVLDMGVVTVNAGGGTTLGSTNKRCPAGNTPFGTAYVIQTEHRGGIEVDINGIRNSVGFNPATYTVFTGDTRAYVADNFERSSSVTVQWIIYCM